MFRRFIRPVKVCRGLANVAAGCGYNATVQMERIRLAVGIGTSRKCARY